MATPIQVRVRLSADDWARVALTAIGEGGVSAVAVEPLAVRLGTTKGSFYWHFPRREALISAALALWERERTEAVIDAIDDGSDPAVRLRRLFGAATGAGVHDWVELALLATADHPLVGPVLQRVTERRLGYLATLFAELDFDPSEARSHALLAYSAYLGYLQLARATPTILPLDAAERRRYLDRVVALLVSHRP